MKVLGLTVWFISGAALPCATAFAQVTTRVSLDSAGAQSDGDSYASVISANGRFVAFTSWASNFAAGDSSGDSDVFLRDLVLGTTTCVSVDSAGQLGTMDNSLEPAISADGRYVAFASRVPDLVPGDTNGSDDVFVHDTLTGATTRVSVDSMGAQGAGQSNKPSISGDGRYVAFLSDAGNLVPNDTNFQRDAFVHDVVTGVTTRVSVDSSGAQGNNSTLRASVSADGRFVAFESAASNLVPGDGNSKLDVFVHDRLGSTTIRASVGAAGLQGNSDSYSPSISGDGRYVAFASLATNLVAADHNGAPDVFVRDCLGGTTTIVSLDSRGRQGIGGSVLPSITADGRFVAFESTALFLVDDDSNRVRDVFVHDRLNASTTRVSRDSAGAQGNATSWFSSISADGRFVAFGSGASNLAPNDTNAMYDVFVHDRLGCSVANYCTGKVNSAGCTPSIVATGTPSASTGSGFSIGAVQVLDGRVGVLVFGIHGASEASFQGGRLCVSTPLKRTPAQTASSLGSPPCVGTYAFDFNARIASGVDPTLVLGQQVWAQYWMRDGAASFGTGLSDAVTFVIGR